jgi:hypothetical protein
MPSSKQIRLILAQVISGLALLFALLYTIGFYDSSLKVSIAGRGSTLFAIFFAVVGFVLALKIRAPPVATLLTLGGIVIWIPPLGAIVSAGAILFPGPILGVISFSPILGLGIVKFLTTYMSKKAEKTRSDRSENLPSTSAYLQDRSNSNRFRVAWLSLSTF